MITTILHSRSNAEPFSRVETLLNAVTTTGAGDYVDFESMLSKFTYVVSWGGTVPTNVVVSLDGSIDGVTYVALQTDTVTASPTMIHLDLPAGVRYVKGNYVSKAGGDATTSVTIKIMAGGN